MRVLVASSALGMLTLVAAGFGYPAFAAPTDDSPSGAAIMECRSGIVTDGDVQTSSLVVTRVDAAPPELPGGCSVTP